MQTFTFRLRRYRSSRTAATERKEDRRGGGARSPLGLLGSHTGFFVPRDGTRKSRYPRGILSNVNQTGLARQGVASICGILLRRSFRCSVIGVCAVSVHAWVSWTPHSLEGSRMKRKLVSRRHRGGQARQPLSPMREEEQSGGEEMLNETGCTVYCLDLVD